MSYTYINIKQNTFYIFLIFVQTIIILFFIKLEKKNLIQVKHYYHITLYQMKMKIIYLTSYNIILI